MRENDGYGAERSNAHNYWESTKEPYIGFAKFMNDAIGGGDEYKSGSVDPLGYLFDTTVMEISTDYNPAALQHLLEYSLGGIYRFGTSTYDAMARTIDNREVDIASAVCQQDIRSQRQRLFQTAEPTTTSSRTLRTLERRTKTPLVMDAGRQ